MNYKQFIDIINNSNINKNRYIIFLLMITYMLYLTKAMNDIFIFGFTLWVFLFYHSLFILEIIYNKY